MNKGLLGKILICTVSFSAALCAYLDARNDVTKLMIELPKHGAELALIEEQNTILQYNVEKFEHPSYLLGLLKTAEYASLLSGVGVETIALKSDTLAEDKKENAVTGLSGKMLLGSGVR